MECHCLLQGAGFGEGLPSMLSAHPGRILDPSELRALGELATRQGCSQRGVSGTNWPRIPHLAWFVTLRPQPEPGLAHHAFCRLAVLW